MFGPEKVGDKAGKLSFFRHVKWRDVLLLSLGQTAHDLFIYLYIYLFIYLFIHSFAFIIFYQLS